MKVVWPIKSPATAVAWNILFRAGPALSRFEVFGRTGPPFWTVKIPYQLTFILPLIAMLTKESEVLQPDAFCEHTMQQNAAALR